MPDTKVRIAAVQALLMHDANRAEVITLLADLLRDTEAQVRREAIDGLGELVAHDPSARAHIESALSDSDADVRALARYWLTEEEDEGSDVAGDDAQGDGDD
jgi:HEAT repeat protein